MNFMNELCVNESGVISALLCKGALRRRFLDIGLFKGSKVKKVSTSPLGDPSCYLINGTMVAIRRKDAAKVGINKTK